MIHWIQLSDLEEQKPVDSALYRRCKHIFLMKFCFPLYFALIFLSSACKKHQVANPYDAMNNTAAQNALLLEGSWIEDSLNISYVGTFVASPGSYLNIDSNLNYSFYQAVEGSSDTNSESGRITFEGPFYISFNLGPNDYDFLRAIFQISVATNHNLVLFGGIDAGPTQVPTFYYHK
jgi:hypothetical protein